MIPSPVRARIARDAARACLHLLYRVRVAGASHVPTTGAVVLAANHTGYLDGALVFAVAPRPSHFLVLAVMFEGVVGRLMSWSGQIPIEQHRGDRRALGRAREVLDRGGVVGIFPEGGRGRGDFAVTGKGVAWLALQSGAPVVPTACLGTRRTGDLAASWPRLRSRMVVDFGAPVVLDLPLGAPGRTRLDLATAQLRAALVEHVHAAAQRHGIPLPADVPPDLVSWGAPAVGENGRMSTEEPLTGTADPAAVERALRAGLEDFDLSDEDRALLDRGDGAVDAAGSGGPLPVVAVIGRPNVGKSTLVNRVIGRREAVVEDVPGVTRDRVAYDAEWTGTHFTLVDTGGWAVDATGIHLRVAEQAEIAVELADAVLFVVDATVGATDDDANVVRLLRRSGKPVVLIANKVDDQRTEADAAALWNLGLGQPWPVSALHGRGSGDALDALLDVLPEVSAAGGAYERGGPRRVALLGRPNVGKSSMLNKLVGRERVVVDAVAGTTRDPVDELIELGGRTWRFVDTAGIRRRVHQTRGADFYASLRTQTALEKAEVAVVLVDASEVISEQDVRVIQQVIDAGRALVIAYNKWDLTDEERRHFLQREIERDLVQIPWAPRVNVSARTGRHMEKLVPALDTALTSWGTRISTGRLNAFLGEVVAAHPHPVRGGKQPRILFATQAGTQPPRFVLFASGFIEAGYRRFVERRLREEFGFEGTPIEISVRVREKRSRR